MCEWLTPNSIMQLDISSYNLKNYELSTSKEKELLLRLQSFIYQKENRTNGGTDSN